MQKNTSSQKWVVFAFDRTDNTPLTGDAANITANIRIDGGAANAVDDTNPTELEDGYYAFDITAAESNGDSVLLTGASTTGDIQIVACPPALYTTPAGLAADVASILADTNELQADDVPGLISTLDAVVDTVKAETSLIVADTNELQADDVPGLIATLDAVVDTVKVDTAAVLVDTGTTLPATLSTIDGNVDAVLVDTGTTLPATLSTIDGNVDAVLVDTNELQTDWVDGGRLDLLLDSASSAGDPWATAIPGAYGAGTAGKILGDNIDSPLSTIDTNVDAVLVDTGTTLPATLSTIDGNVDAVLVDTGTTLPATLSTIDGNVDAVLVDTATTLPATLSTIDGNVDAVLVDTGTTLQAELDAIQAAVITNAAGVDIAADIIAMKAETALIVADTNELQVDNVPGLIATLDAVVDTVKVDTAAVLVDTGTTLPATLSTIDGNVDAVLVDTNELQTDWANGGRLDLILDSASAAGDPWATAIPGAYGAGTAGKILGDNIDSPLSTIDTNVDAVLVDTGTTLQAELDAIQAAVITNAAGVDIAADIIAMKAETVLIVADTNELQTDWADGGRLDLILDTASGVGGATNIDLNITEIKTT